MEPGKKDRYNEAAASYNRHLRSGDLAACNRDLHDMVIVHTREGREVDALKTLMLMFHFDLNGAAWPGSKEEIAKTAMQAYTASGLSVYEMRELYLDTIRMDTVPRPFMTVQDSLYIFELYLAGKCVEADEILRRLGSTT